MKQEWTDRLKERMAGYEETPPDMVWKSVIDGLGSRSEIRRGISMPAWLFVGCSAAAALLLGIFLTFRFSGSGSPGAEMDRTASVLPSGTADRQDYVSGEVAVEVPGTAGMMPASGNAPAVVLPHADVPACVDVTECGEQQLYDDNPKENDVPVTGNADAETMASAQENEDDSPEAWQVITDEETHGNRRKNRRGRFSASIGAAGSFGGSVQDSKPVHAVLGANPLDSGVSYADWADAGFADRISTIVYNQPEVATEYYHKIPVKIGISVRYVLADRIGIESGLTYSLLSSELKTGSESSGSWSRGEQSLHYIGIPLNLTVNILDSKWFDLYLSAGGMAEKCVKGTLRTDEYAGGRYQSDCRAAVRQSGLQWSVNAAAGLQANILPGVGIYVEPGVSRRFKGDSRVRTIYSDRPVDFSLGFGLRFQIE